MALIKCPECGKEISDKSKQCIHCGYPLDELKNETSNIINNENSSYSVKLISFGKQKVKVIKIVREVSGLGLKEAKDMVDNFLLIKTNISLDEANSIKKQIEEVGGAVKITEFNADDVVISQTELNIPKCPTCGSTDISKISTTSKAVSVGLFGIFSSKIRKQFHCNSCKYEW